MPLAKFRLKGIEGWLGEISYGFEDIRRGGKKEKQFRLVLIYIEQEYRKKGFGTKIMNYVIEKAKKSGCKCIVVDLTEKSYDFYSGYGERKKFFEKFGFMFDAEGNYGRLDFP